MTQTYIPGKENMPFIHEKKKPHNDLFMHLKGTVREDTERERYLPSICSFPQGLSFEIWCKLKPGAWEPCRPPVWVLGLRPLASPAASLGALVDKKSRRRVATIRTSTHIQRQLCRVWLHLWATMLVPALFYKVLNPSVPVCWEW